jgi:predicted RNase H-like nuclease (RuvC/YqgF family)
MTNPNNLCLDNEDPSILLTKCSILDTVNEIKDLIESVPNGRDNNQSIKRLHDKQEKIKNILKDAYTEVRKSQSQIIEKVNQVKYLTRRTEILKSELTNSLESTYTSKSGLNSTESSQGDTNHNMYTSKNIEEDFSLYYI